MTVTQTIEATGLPTPPPPPVLYQPINKPLKTAIPPLPPHDPFDTPPNVLVKKALNSIREAGIELIAWGQLLHKIMHVPVILTNFTYVVPDERLEEASGILSKMYLPISSPHSVLLKTAGDLQGKGRMHRITRATRLGSAQYLHLVPASFPDYDPSELHEVEVDGCTLLIPRQSAVYASVLRMLARYPRKNSPIRTALLAQLEMLIHYNLMDLQDGYVDVDDDAQWQELQMDKRIQEAVCTVWTWGLDREWHEGDEWIQDALVSVIAGKADMGNLPWTD